MLMNIERQICLPSIFSTQVAHGTTSHPRVRAQHHLLPLPLQRLQRLPRLQARQKASWHVLMQHCRAAAIGVKIEYFCLMVSHCQIDVVSCHP